MIATIAFHGDFANGKILRRDMGDPEWVDLYYEGHDLPLATRVCSAFDTVVLVAYSFGGSLIGHLSHVLTNIAAVVLYESPLMGIDEPAGQFPVLWVRNDYKSTRRREKEFAATLVAWQADHNVDKMTGNGRHVRFACGWPPIGHAWDRSLNSSIRDWMKYKT